MKRATVVWSHNCRACYDCITEASLIAHQGDLVGRAKAEAMDASIPSKKCTRGGKCKPRDNHYFMSGGKKIEPSEMEYQEGGAGRPTMPVLRDRAIQIRVSESEWEGLYSLAESKNVSLSTLCRDAALEKLGEKT